MAIRIDDSNYRSLYDAALAMTQAMAPQVAQHALANGKDPAEAVGDALDAVFKRVLEGYEKLEGYTKEPAKRPASIRPKPRVPFA